MLSNPEFLAEGSAISDLEAPDRVLIGGEDGEAIEDIHARMLEVAPILEEVRGIRQTLAEGGGTGDELRRLADLELESSLDKRISDDETTQQRGIEEALRAIGIYESYLKKYPARKDNDRILYQLSRAYDEVGDPGQNERCCTLIDRFEVFNGFAHECLGQV